MKIPLLKHEDKVEVLRRAKAGIILKRNVTKSYQAAPMTEKKRAIATPMYPQELGLMQNHASFHPSKGPWQKA